MKTTKHDFALFLLNDELRIFYNKKTFTKKINKKTIDIYVDNNIVYKIHKDKKLLLVVNASYCCMNDENYFNIDKFVGLEEWIIDEKTLIRIEH